MTITKALGMYTVQLGSIIVMGSSLVQAIEEAVCLSKQ